MNDETSLTQSGLRALRAFVVKKAVLHPGTSGARDPATNHHEATKRTKFALPDRQGDRTGEAGAIPTLYRCPPRAERTTDGPTA